MQALPWEYVSYSGGLYWFVHSASVLIRYKQTTIDLSRSCGHLCGCPSGYAVGLRESQRRSRQLLVSPECWDARWLPDWFSGPFPILYHLLSLSVLELCGWGPIFWTCASRILLRWALLYPRALSLIYERKSSRVQFSTAGPDNGGDWMKQFVTFSLPLTFTGCWPIGLKGFLFGGDVRGWSCGNRFFCNWFRMCTHNRINGR